MAKLSPEKRAARAAKFRATMAAKRAGGAMVQVSAADVLGAIVDAPRVTPGPDRRIILAMEIVQLLRAVLR
jgi:hypothetical protein